MSTPLPLVRRLVSASALAGLAGVFCVGQAGQAGQAAEAAPATAPSTAPSTVPASQAPDPDSLRAFDLPSDDGSEILVQWARPAKEAAGVKYALEIARSQADFDSGAFKTQVVEPSEKALASSKPELFGYSKANAGLYFARVAPAALFLPREPPDPTPERLKELAASGDLSPGQLARALKAWGDTRPDSELGDDQKADRRWFDRLKAFVKGQDREALEARKRQVSGETWYLRLAVVRGGRKTYVVRDGRPAVVSASARANLFKWPKLNNLVFSLVFMGVVFAFIEAARRRPGLFIRKIAGLDAVDEAIGRATEMDRPVFFVHGLSDMDSLATIAAVNILARVARRAAEDDSRVRVMNSYPIVTAVSQEVVQQAYTEAGRPDAYNPDDVSLVASDQFSYVAAVSGAMVRQRPGAIFYLGYFFAESLLLAETGASTGAIQVAGTDAYTQLPFFVTTCDYTLIGEELYAASAYLSREPRLLGSLRGQDVGKAFLMIAIVAGAVALTVAAAFGKDLSWLRSLLQAG